MWAFEVLCVIVTGMLLLSVNALAEVYDDEGEIITEEEIKYQMNLEHGCRHGCCLVGTFFGFGLAGNAVGGLSSVILKRRGIEGDLALGYVMLGAMVGGVIGGYFSAKYSWKVGEEIDSETAIEKIKAKRRSRKKNEDKGSLAPESKIALQLAILSGRF